MKVHMNVDNNIQLSFIFLTIIIFIFFLSVWFSLLLLIKYLFMFPFCGPLVDYRGSMKELMVGGSYHSIIGF